MGLSSEAIFAIHALTGMAIIGRSKYKAFRNAEKLTGRAELEGLEGAGGAKGGKYSAFGEMSEADGIRYRDWNYEKIKELSIKNPNADSMTLGKYLKKPDGSVSSKAYTEMAKGTGDTYFDLGAKWGEIEKSYGLTDKDMFALFNQSALDDAVTKEKTIRFSQDPTAYGECALKSEWDYLVSEHGYTRLKQIGDYWYAK